MRPLLPALVLLLGFISSVSAQTQLVLAPFDTMVLPSASGRWVAELWVHNAGTVPFDIPYAFCPDFCRQVLPGETERLDVFAEANAVHPGVLLDAPLHARFSLRVRDGNDPDQVGTEIPVVREADFRRGITTLINVPVGLTLRPALRIYLRSDQEADFLVSVSADNDGRVLAQRLYRHRTAGPPLPNRQPATLDASSILRGWVADRLRVTIEPLTDIDYWPLLTITNRNNQITVVSPQ